MIVNRQSAREVLTRTGNMYVLHGSIDDGKMRAQGFPEDIISAFTDGFPDDWAALLPACLRCVEGQWGWGLGKWNSVELSIATCTLVAMHAMAIVKSDVPLRKLETRVY